MLPIESCNISINQRVKRELIKRHGRIFYRSVSIYLQSISHHLSGHSLSYLFLEFQLENFEVVGFKEFDSPNNIIYQFTINNQ